jgi:hypothetical protein
MTSAIEEREHWVTKQQQADDTASPDGTTALVRAFLAGRARVALSTDFLRVRRPILRTSYGNASESPQTQAKRPTPIPRVFEAFRPCLLTFAKP